METDEQRILREREEIRQWIIRHEHECVATPRVDGFTAMRRFVHDVARRLLRGRSNRPNGVGKLPESPG